MKLLFLSNLYPPNAIGGYEQLCFDMAQALEGKGYEVVALTSTYGQRDVSASHTVYRTLRLHAPEDNIYQPHGFSDVELASIDAHNCGELSRVVGLERPDAVFVWNLFFLSPALLDELRELQVPVVYFLTDNWLAAFLKPDYVAKFFRDQVFSKRSLVRDIWSRVRSREQKVHLGAKAIFSSRFMEEFYRRANILFDEACIIHNGVNYPLFHESRRPIADKGPIKLLFAGRVVEIKGVETAIRALPKILANCPERELSLTIVGDQREKPFVDAMHSLVRELGLDDCVSFREPVSEVELSALFAGHDIYLFPSLYEPFSLTLLHAMNAGIPIVSSTAGGNVEVIRNAETGMLHPPGDAVSLASGVCRLIHNQELAAAVSGRAKAVSNNYRFDDMVARVASYLEACISRTGA